MTQVQIVSMVAAVSFAALVFVALAVGAGIIEAFRRRLLESGDDPALVIVPPVVKFEGLDEGLRKRTEARRRAAEQLKSRARTVEAGGQAAPVDVLVPGRRRA